MAVAPEIIVGILALIGTAFGSITGVLAANRLTTYRIEQLEKKVDKHNSVIDRQYKIEEEFSVLSEKQKVANHRIDDLEERKNK